MARIRMNIDNDTEAQRTEQTVTSDHNSQIPHLQFGSPFWRLKQSQLSTHAIELYFQHNSNFQHFDKNLRTAIASILQDTSGHEIPSSNQVIKVGIYFVS